MNDDVLTLGGRTFTNRLLTGTGKFASHAQIPRMLAASGSQMITVALRRIDTTAQSENILDYIPKKVTLLPNTSGARTAEQAVRIARIAREARLRRLHQDRGDHRHEVHDAGTTGRRSRPPRFWPRRGSSSCLTCCPICRWPNGWRMRGPPRSCRWALRSAPIGAWKPRPLIELLIDNCTVPIVVDAGIGKPSQAAAAMEMGADAVLVNTAIATAKDPEAMGRAFDRRFGPAGPPIWRN
jgi:Uncharacterized enzyme of thiazole biosynthesis